jgi:hypothetical protein
MANPVVIRVATKGRELKVARYFSLESPRQSLKNHCVPMLDSFQNNKNKETSYVVIPFLIQMDDLSLDLVDNILDFVDQVLKVSVFDELRQMSLIVS